MRDVPPECGPSLRGYLHQPTRIPNCTMRFSSTVLIGCRNDADGCRPLGVFRAAMEEHTVDRNRLPPLSSAVGVVMHDPAVLPGLG
jgi:hypothetical protein